MRRGVRYCSSESMIGAPGLHYYSFNLTWYLGFVLFCFSERSESETPHPMAKETVCAAPVASQCLPLSSFLPLPCFLPPVCVCKLCIQTAATFRCWKCHWLLHLRPAHRLTSSLPAVPTSHLQPQSAWEFGVWNVLWLSAGLLASPSSLWGDEEREENLHQLVLCNKLSLVFCFDLI